MHASVADGNALLAKRTISFLSVPGKALAGLLKRQR
jgi:hypothetical protein